MLAHWLVCPHQHVLKNIGSKNSEGNDDEAVDITANLLSLLLYLASQPNRIVSRDELMQQVWQGSIVSEETISRAVAHLRKLLGDSAKNPQFIRTISKQGYQLLLTPVFTLPVDVTPIIASESSPETTNTKTPRSVWAIAKTLILLVVLMVVFYLGFNGFSGHSVTEQAPSTRFAQLVKSPLTSGSGWQRFPRFSADGRFIISVEHREQTSSLMIHDLLNGSAQPLFQSSKVTYSSPSFSPDGNEIVYLESIKPQKHGERQCGLYVYTFKTQSSRKVMACGQLFRSNFSWTADGQSVISSWYRPESTTAGVVKINLNNGEVTDVAFPSQDNSGYLFGRLSPDNQRIALVFIDGKSNDKSLALFDLKTSQFTPIASQFTAISQVVWGDDNQTLYFSDDSMQAAGIWQLNLQTQQSQLLYNEKIIDFDVDPKHNRFISSIVDGQFDIWRAQENEKGKVSHQQLSKTVANEGFPEVDPLGLQLAFTSNRSGAYNVWLRQLAAKLEGPERQEIPETQAVQLSHFQNGKLRNLRWSSDSLYLSFIHTFSGDSQLVVLAVGGAEAVKGSGEPVATVENVSFASWDKLAGRLNMVFADPKRPGVYQLNLATEVQTLLIADSVMSVEALDNGYLVQKSYAGPLFKILPPQRLLSANQWQPFLPHQKVHNWRVHDDFVSVLGIDSQAQKGVYFYDVATAQAVSDYLSLQQRFFVRQYSLHRQSKTFYYLKGDKRSVHLYLIKPVD